jgi:hypothetical protein
MSDISKFTVETFKIPEARTSRISVALDEYFELLEKAIDEYLLLNIYIN